MSYWLGVDIGTTFTAAAVCRNGRAEVAELGNRSDEVPSIVFVGVNGEVVIGEAAARRAVAEPDRVAREFKRRVGDPVAILVGGAPYSAHALMARMLEYVLETVSAAQQERPAGIVLAHPANWGTYKQDLLLQAARMAGAESVQLRSEPECAAVMYAAGEHVGPDEIIAVYDLGGGTFDAAVLRKTIDGFVLLGEPEGIEQLGGIDFDDAVFQHVLAAVGGPEQFDLSDEAVGSALRTLRRDCVEAKEFLSYDPVATVPLAAPRLHTTVRIIQSELEDMVRPALMETVTAMHRALRSAGVVPEQLRAILLAGGSSRIPLVKDLIAAEFRCPVVLDSRPKHGVALGAALIAGGAEGGAAEWAPDAAAPPYGPGDIPYGGGDPSVPTAAMSGRPQQGFGPIPSPPGRSGVDPSPGARRTRVVWWSAGAAVAVAAIVLVVVLVIGGARPTASGTPTAVPLTSTASSTGSGTSAAAVPSGNVTSGGVATSSPGGTAAAVAPGVATSAADLGGMDALVAAANNEGALNVIGLPTSEIRQAQGWADYVDVIKDFQAKYPKITVTSLLPNAQSAQELSTAESTKGTDQAPDVFDIDSATALANTASFAPYKVAAWQDIPDANKESTGLWFNDYTGVLSVGYNPDLTGSGLNSLADLNTPALKGLVVLNGDPTTTNQALQTVAMASLANGGSLDDIAKGVDYFRSLKVAGVLASTQPSAQGLDNNTIGVTFGWSYNHVQIAARRAKLGFKWATFAPAGVTLTSYFSQAVNKDAPHPAAARLWEEYLYTAAAQNTLMKGGVRPVLYDAMKTAGTLDTSAAAESLPVMTGKPVWLSAAQVAKASAYLNANWAKAVG